MDGLSLSLVVPIALAWLCLAAFSSEVVVSLLLLWLPVQGWIQLNWLDDSSSTVLLYEFQVLALYLVFGLRALLTPKEFTPPRLLWFAAPFVAWALALMPQSIAGKGLLVALVGLRATVLPLPLVWIGYRAFRTRRQLETASWLLMLQLPLIAAVTAYQFTQMTPLSGWVQEVPRGFLVAGVIRPPGTFSAPGQLGNYLLLSVPLGIGLMGMDVALWKRAGFAIGLIAATVALVTNTQRSTIVVLVVALPLIALFARRLRALRMIVVALALIVVGLSLGNSVAGTAFVERITSIANDLDVDLRVVPIERFSDALRNPLFGEGLGTASPGIRRLDAPTSRVVPLRTADEAAESFAASLVYESGLPGLALFVLFVATLLFAEWKALSTCRSSDLTLLAAAILSYQIGICLMSWTYDPLHYPPSRVLFWFWGGVVLSLPRLQDQVVTARNRQRERLRAIVARRAEVWTYTAPIERPTTALRDLGAKPL